MEITKIELGGFCNIKHFEINMTDFNALVAPNNYGKSNVLAGISFALKFIKATEADKISMMSDTAYIPINRYTSALPFRFTIELTDASHKIRYTYSFSFEWARTDNKNVANIIEELLTEMTDKYLRPHCLLKRTKQDGGLYVPSPTGRCKTPANASRTQLVINQLNESESLFYKDAISAINHLGVNMISTDGFNKQQLTQFIYQLKEQQPLKYSMLEDVTKKIVTSIDTITPVRTVISEPNPNIPYRIEDAIYDLRIKERNNNQDISVARLSSGSRRIITIISEIIMAKMNGASLICIEELENSVHPKLLENLILLVQEFAEGVRIITTSHSPYLVRYLNSEQLTFGLPSAEGTAFFRKLKPTKVKKVVKAASSMEITLGEYMFEMMLEIDTDSEYIKELFEA